MNTIETNLVQKSADKMFGTAILGAAVIMVGAINNHPNLVGAGIGACGGSFLSELMYLKDQIKYGFYNK